MVARFVRQRGQCLRVAGDGFIDKLFRRRVELADFLPFAILVDDDAGV
jgi:hypothetical protein